MAHVFVASFEDAYARALYIPVLDAAKTLVQVAGLREGVPYDVIFDQLIRPASKIERLILADRSLAAHITAFGEDDFEEILESAMSDINLARTISDALSMLSITNYAPIAAGRVADSIVRMITGGRAAKDWDAMRSTINVDKAFVKLLTDQAKSARHGDRIAVSAEVVRDIADRSWILLNRYLAYLRGGKIPLNTSDYPYLTG